MIDELKLLFKYKEMMRTTIAKELRARYKGSVLGFLWTFINPLLQLLVYSFAFRYILRVNIPGVNFTIFLFVGLTTWSCFTNSLLMGSNVIVSNGNLIKKIFFPRIILPVASVTGNVINMLLVFLILFPVVWLSGYQPNWYYLFIPLLVIIQWILNLGFVFLLSGAFVYFRDLEHILNVVLMAWMYMTPIIYSEEFIPATIFHVFKLNPMYPLITSYQRILLFNQAPDLAGLAYAAIFALLVMILGYAGFHSMQRRFAEEL